MKWGRLGEILRKALAFGHYEMGEIGGDIAESACFRTFGKQTTKGSLRNPKNSAKFGRIRPIPQIYHEKGRFLRTDGRTDGQTDGRKHFGPQSWGTNYLAHQNFTTHNSESSDQAMRGERFR